MLTKNQLAGMLTREGFTRDEWYHLLRLLNNMSFSMFSCSHFNNFLSDPIGKQSAMSKRGQEGTSRGGSATAKPRPMNLVSHNLLSTRKNSPQDMSDSTNPEKPKRNKVVFHPASGNRCETREDTQNPNTWKQ